MRVTGRSERKTAEKVAEKWGKGREREGVGRRELPLVQLLNKFLNTQVALSRIRLETIAGKRGKV